MNFDLIQVEVKMPIVAFILGITLIFFVLWEAFEVILLPRRVTRKYRFTRFFYRSTWRVWAAAFRSTSRGGRQETFLGYFGPLSLLLLLSIWAFGLIVGFAFLHWASGSQIKTPEGSSGLSTDLYLSATTFFTLGLGDVTPVAPLARVFTAVEAGLGFGFLALLFAYLPGLNQLISRREINISLLDARAGSPPTAAQMLRRRCHDTDNMNTLLQHLSEWERWAAELLESHLSYPVLAYFRSHHDNQS
ncbi:MAG TPA: potassium channel family protein, partial [Thermodesulfovibrionales bacterium]|nr:potassium channel family protein [Thermodesulfovibrionales bacterium]